MKIYRKSDLLKLAFYISVVNSEFTVNGNTKIENLTEEMNTKLDYMAKQEKNLGKKKYFNISYGMPSLTRGNGLEKLNSDFAVAINRGNTYYLHKSLFRNVEIRIGLDSLRYSSNKIYRRRK